ncbi:hypothetical protein O3G_MSEX003857 [Manduca sexta]|uniref:Cathepsin propeptide inhibitor domain-containing protein n=1 Tax=Manduca sexta TaxID=7130 RepID=A0A921YT05_MANSE|nr:hypothetical protein O3G_MSEX003857 [Manduca sexta]
MNTFLVLVLCACAYLDTVHCVHEDYTDTDVKADGHSVRSARPEETSPQYDINDAKNLFDQFILDYHKTYADAKEYEQRYINFVNNLKDIIQINKDGGSATINLFADLSESEFP